MKKDIKSESPNKKSKKGLFIIVGVLLLLIGGGLFLMSKSEISYNDKKEVNANLEVAKNIDKKSELLDLNSTLDSITIDTNNLTEQEPEIFDEEEIDVILNDISQKNKRKPKPDYENNPKNWNLLKMEEDDTSFFIIKNKITGTKLSNQYYSKTKAQEELKNFKKIITK